MTLVADRPTITIDVPAIDTRTPYQKLADAIEAGSRLVPQCRGEYVQRDYCSGAPLAACAIGAAILAYRVQREIDIYEAAGFDEMPIVRNPINGNAETMGGIIVDLNDDFCWTREQIADWLRTL